MAQATAPMPNGTSSTMATDELREILEYGKIVQFRDAVFAGSHPRIKLPHLAGKQIESPCSTSTPGLLTPVLNTTSQYTRPASRNNHQAPVSHINSRSPNSYRVTTGKSEINPILLEKSDDLIRAEIQLQRQRLERSLREQMEQQKAVAKAQLQSAESLPNFNLSEVLSKALARVPPAISAAVEAPVDARSSASDSFDDNTFYSSQHDTPEPFSSPNGPKEPGEVKSNGVISIDERPAEGLSTESHERQDVLSNNNHPASHPQLQAQKLPSQLPTQTRSVDLQQSLEMSNSESSSSRGAHIGGTSDVSSQQKEEVRVDAQRNVHPEATVIIAEHAVGQLDGQVSTEHLQQAFANDTTSPLIRAHNLSPVAPQPARVSPLATAREPPIVQEARYLDEAQPAQVTALRQQPPVILSADSSPTGAKFSDRKKAKKEKKKKRKASINGNATPDSPYIKPEPRSPSPFSTTLLPRPQKRQRQVGQFAAELNYDEPNGEAQGYVTERYEQAPVPKAREQLEDHYDQRPQRVEPSYQRLERDNGDYRVSSGGYVRRPYTPTAYALPYGSGQGDQVRTASHGMVERRAYEEPVYYREPVPRYSMRPDANRDRSRSPVIHERRSPMPMPPPPAPLRIVMDEYGREYIDRTPPPTLRQSVAPPARYRDSEVIYERAPIRTVSARGPVEAYEGGGVVYRRPSPPMAAPRRVVTQPEYAIPEYRSYRQREYSARPGPMAPPGEEVIQVRGPVDRRQMSHFEEVPREYAARAPTVRPEPIRYEVPREYVGRLQSVRPEPPPREYAASVRPGARREMPIQSQREYSVRPVETMPRREHAAGPEPERYYDELPRARPAEVAFIERPRAREASVVVYADDVRREVYR